MSRVPPGADDLGQAVLSLVRIPPQPAPDDRSTRQQLRYLTAKTTGASNQSITRQLGIKAPTLRSWLTGTAKPSAASARKIDELFQHFWQVNNANKFTTAARTTKQLKITGNPQGIITIQGRPRASIIVERGRRKWVDVLLARTPREAYEAFANDVIGPSPLPTIHPDYLWFHQGTYKIVIS
jgi:hypothetical protein